MDDQRNVKKTARTRVLQSDVSNLPRSKYMISKSESINFETDTRSHYVFKGITNTDTKLSQTCQNAHSVVSRLIDFNHPQVVRVVLFLCVKIRENVYVEENKSDNQNNTFQAHRLIFGEMLQNVNAILLLFLYI